MIRGFVGSCGSGKTWAMQSLVGYALRHGRGPFLVLDPNGEWAPGALAEPIRAHGGGYRWARCASVDEARACMELEESKRPRLVIVVPGSIDDAEDGDRPLAGPADALARVAIDYPGPAIVCLPEAHTSAREHYPLPPALRSIAHRWRHSAVNAGCWWDTQHFADVSKDLERASTLLYLFGNAGHADGLKLRQLGGPELVSAVSECGARAAAGEPGWHVRLTTLERRPPFELRRV